MKERGWENRVSRRTFVKSVAAASVMVATKGGTSVMNESSLKRFDRVLIRSHFAEDDQLSPDFIGSVELGESFILETENSNDANGPVSVAGVKAGDAITVEIEEIEIVGPVVAPNGGPLDGFEGIELELQGGYLYFPEHFRIRPRPTLGNIAILPSPEEREKIMQWAAGIGYHPRKCRGSGGSWSTTQGESTVTRTAHSSVPAPESTSSPRSMVPEYASRISMRTWVKGRWPSTG